MAKNTPLQCSGDSGTSPGLLPAIELGGVAAALELSGELHFCPLFGTHCRGEIISQVLLQGSWVTDGHCACSPLLVCRCRDSACEVLLPGRPQAANILRINDIWRPLLAVPFGEEGGVCV